MFNTLGIVQAQGGLPGQAGQARKLGGKSLLEWVVRQVTECQRLDRVIVLAGPEESQREAARHAPPDVPVFLGSRPDMLGCFAEALAYHPARAVVRVVADNPYTDPVLVDRLVKTADENPHCDYISYCFRDGRLAIFSAMGVWGEWCRASALIQAAREAVSHEDRRQPAHYLYAHAEKFNVRLIPAPAELDREDLRLQIACEEDWEHAETIFDALGAEALDWRQVAGLLDQNPALRSRMATLNRGAE